MKEFQTVYKNAKTNNIENFKLKNIFKDAKYLFNKNKNLFITAPRQSGKTIFLTDVALNNIINYDQIIITSFKSNILSELSERIRCNLEYHNIDKLCTKYSYSEININNCNILFKHSINDIEFENKKTLILFDEYLFDNKLTEKLEIIDNNYNNHIHILGTSSRVQNSSYIKLITKDLMKTEYTLFPIHFSDVNTIEYLNTILKHYPDNILFEYI